MPQPMFECPARVQAAGRVCLLPQQHATLEAQKHALLQGLLHRLVPIAGLEWPYSSEPLLMIVAR
jgi:hypothetical protein